MILSNSSLTMFQRTVRSWASTNHQHFVVGGAVVRRSIMGGVLAVCSGDQHNDRNVLSWSERALKNNTQALSPAVLQASQERGQAQAPAQQLHQLEQRRYRHSKRQIRRLFKGPRRAYLDRLAGIDRSPKPPPAVEYLPVFTPEKVLPNGWSSPPPPTFERPEYPFTVKRTRNKPHGAVGFLPIYSKFRKDGTKCTTVVKKIKGDLDRFVLELRAVLEIPIPKNPKEDRIRIRAGGNIEVDGHHVKSVRDWLAGLGF